MADRRAGGLRRQRGRRWGDGSPGTATVNGSGTTHTFTVYGRIPARQNAVVGSYSDTITVTITF